VRASNYARRKPQTAINDVTLDSRVTPSVVRSRSFATEEAKASAEQPELTENEKKLMGEKETLAKEVETLTEKHKELDVSFDVSNGIDGS
jgi:peptidoglycan hydrolase CwlO-like protein